MQQQITNILSMCRYVQLLSICTFFFILYEGKYLELSRKIQVPTGSISPWTLNQTGHSSDELYLHFRLVLPLLSKEKKDSFFESLPDQDPLYKNAAYGLISEYILYQWS